MKKYVVIAGVNGAGKSTLYQTTRSLQNMLRVNTDEIVQSFGDWRSYSDVAKAGKEAVSKIQNYFENGQSFNQETTLCGKSILRNIQKAKSKGYRIEMHYVGLESAELAKRRVAYRVEHGGHGIPDKDVERRYEESFQNLKKVISLCDLMILYDNTDQFNRFAIYKSGELVRLSHRIIPEWYKKLNI